jgi:short-subunit dehydrogenase
VPDLSGRTALVTGASAGIGREIARVLAGKVGALVLVARRRERLEELARELGGRHPSLRVVVRDVDLTDRRAAAAMVDGLEKDGEHIEVLVNNAGFGVWGAFARGGWTRYEAMIELNVVCATWLIHRMLPSMIERRYGAVMNVGSSAGMMARPGSAVYGASKAYLNHLNEALAAELVDTGVTLTAVCPGPVPTEFQDVAGSHIRPELPGALHVSAEQCAEEAVAALERGDARVIPGWPMRAAVLSVEAVPKALIRPLLRRAARRLKG